MVHVSNSENPLKEAGIQFFVSLALVLGFIGLYYVKHETPFLDFIPDNPVVTVVILVVAVELIAISALIYSQL